MDTPTLLTRLLDVIERDIAPKTLVGVRAGTKLFGAAILRKSVLSLVVAETNNEIENPLWHGEMHAIKRFYELPDHPAPKDCLFLATHEPCSLCLSGITWSGFDNFYYLFSHRDSADSFAIPYDIQILKAVYAVPDPDRDAAAPGRDLYNRTNDYFTSHDMSRMFAGLDRGHKERLTARIDDLTALYADLSAIYQRDKGKKGIPLS
jgi:tRNA(Arg) A34 adenosine deaminase TadA